MERAVGGMLDLSSTTPATSRRRRRQVVPDRPDRVWVPRLLLVAYVVLLFILRLARDAEPAIRSIGLGDVPNTSYVFGWLRDLAAAALSQAALFPRRFPGAALVPLRRGFLARLSVCTFRHLLPRTGALVRGLGLATPGWPGRLRGSRRSGSPRILAGTTWRRERPTSVLPSSPSGRLAWASSWALCSTSPPSRRRYPSRRGGSLT